MKNFFSSIALSLLLLPAASAQDPYLDAVKRDFILRQLEDQRVQSDLAIEKRKCEEWRQREFVKKINRFVELWARFAQEYNEKRAFNVRIAREISKAFHELESSGEWPR